MKRVLPVAVILASLAHAAWAGPDAFHPGSVISEYGPVATIEDARLSAETRFKIAYDVSEAGAADAPNRRFVTAARFLNMHVEAGVPLENISLAIVVHGGAGVDLVTAEKRGAPNPNADLVAALIEAGVAIELCGQTAAYRDIAVEDLLPGVRIGLSAMTAHALLQQDGYTLNPF